MLIPKTYCPGCRIQFTSDPGFPVGRTIRCPKCGTNFAVEGPALAPKPAPAGAAPAPPPRPAPPPLPVRSASAVPMPVSGRAVPNAASVRTPARPPAHSTGHEAAQPPKSSLFPIVLLVLMVATGGCGYLLYQMKAGDRPGAAARVNAPAPEVAPEVVNPDPVVPVPPVREPAPKVDSPTIFGAPKEKPVVVTPPAPPTPIPLPTPSPPVEALPPAAPPVAVAPPPRPVTPPTPAPAGSIPRRMLFVHASKYLYLNPLTDAPTGGTGRTRATARALAERWDVPTGRENNQLFLLCDTLPPPDGRHLAKNVLETTFRRFFETSRGQDRVVVYFGGHVLERDKKAYLTPADGDPDEVATLVPLGEFYAGLEACPAAQKVVVWDVCRYNPQRGRLRPGSEPMSETLYAALTAAPPGVEVIVTCRPGENALEFFTAPSEAKGATYSGSLFLEAFRSSAGNRPKGAKGPAPADPIPIAELAHDLTLRVAELAKVAPAGATPRQTVGVAGRARNDPARCDPAEPIAARFEIPDATGGADPAEIRALVREFAVPPLRADAGDVDHADVPYRADPLKDCAPDVTIEEVVANKEKYPLRAAVIEGLDEVRGMWAAPGRAGGLRVRDACPAPVTEALKKQLKAEQDAWALGIARLEVRILRLDELSKDRAAQHYDYARAVLKTRLAYMQEYNLAIGNVITETLPELDAKLGHDAYALVWVETAKMKSKRAVKQLATEAAELFEKLASERKGTPWAIQARQERAVPLGLSWQPVATKGPRPGP